MTAETLTTRVGSARQRDFLGRSFGERFRESCWSIVRFTLFRWSPPGLHLWRIGLLRLLGAEVHRSVRIAPSVRIDFPWNLRARAGVAIAHGVILNCMGTVTLGAGTRISQYAHICAGTHDYQSPEMPIVRSPITVGRDVWIAADAFVGPGITIGDGALLAARSSAFGDLPPGQVCIGEPARPRGPRP